MGEFPARIVAEDFVTPPELVAWRLAPDGAGRIGGARFALAGCAGRTRLTTVYEQIPIRMLPLHLGDDEPALIYLLNPTAGLMDGDGHLLEIHAGPGTRAVITGQSATRIHPSLKGFCTQQWKITVTDDAILVVLPGPAIPFAGCRFFQRVHIDLAERAQLIWGDLWFAGRYARQEASERFQFERLVQETLIHRRGRLVFRDRFSWQGPWTEETARWHFGGFPAAATLFATGAWPAELLTDAAKPAASFATAAGDTCCRWIGSARAVVRGLAALSMHLAALMSERPTKNPWLLCRHELARTHWFDVPL